jgi:hypothetical protein
MKKPETIDFSKLDKVTGGCGQCGGGQCGGGGGQRGGAGQEQPGGAGQQPRGGARTGQM